MKLVCPNFKCCKYSKDCAHSKLHIKFPVKGAMSSPCSSDICVGGQGHCIPMTLLKFRLIK